ncbi:MAG: hypothetical protein GTN38_01080 [Candidatus Aenigmarchaeota archaeon]|nr:hypothetical protein [Candidatus Aenigmarchaeota archaeon]NIP40188.1 hypothetical protein [Candidatus Aenigmarchaeota archaeon]NIQ17225.1 hypothetical protein [Candidatus Aenigmarchaeota archaeon]NIS73015.1 hypothetical protein [Candidatus Aenigmarchaeota archaeon]
MHSDNFIALLEKNLGKLPPTVHKAFKGVKYSGKNTLESSKEVYLDSLLFSVKNRPKDKIRRYYALARLVFSYINFLYELMKRVNTRDKFKFFMGRENYLTGNVNSLFFNSVEILIDNLPSKYKMEEITEDEEILRYYDIVFLLLLSRHPGMKKLLFTKHHFKTKILKGRHPLFSKDVIKAYELAFGNLESISPILITLESVIHGIDDYVDVQKQPYRKVFSDVANIVIGLFGILVYVSIRQQKDLFDNVSSLLKKKTKTETILKALKESLVDLTWTPFVEKNVIKILDARSKKEEYKLAIENLETRTKGTTRTLTEPIKILLNINFRDAGAIAGLVWILRAKQMFHKDILDIKTDLKNKDYKAPSVWAKRYKLRTREFTERLTYLNELYYSKSLEMRKHLYKKYPKATEFLIREITKTHNDINRLAGI